MGVDCAGLSALCRDESPATEQQSLSRLLALPLVFLCWGVAAIFHTLAMVEAAAGGFLLALIIGLGLGWRLGKNAGVYREEIRRFERAGSSVPLALMLLTFGLRFYFSCNWQGS